MSEVIAQINQHVEKMKIIQISLLEFIDTDTNEESDFEQFVKILSQYQINKSRIELCALLHMLVQLSNNHFRYPSFFTKIEKIILNLQSQIQQFFTKSEIFHIFRTNKRLLLFLFEQNILTPDQSIANIFQSSKYRKKSYPQYFYPEFKSFFSQDFSEEISVSNQSRKEGENDGFFETIIRKDEVEKFIAHINKNDTSVDSLLSDSIYETNSFLYKNSPSIIEYASFYGSIQIFKYLIGQGATINSNIWLYAIHGNDPEIILYLIENEIEPPSEKNQTPDSIYRKCFNESIKCHHNNIKDYIEQNFKQKEVDKKPNFTSFKLEYDPDFKQVIKIIKYFNYSFFPDFTDCISFEFFCLSQNQPLLEIFFNTSKLNINTFIKDEEEKRFLKKKSLLNIAVEIGNPEIVNYILSFPDIDVNALTFSDFDSKMFKLYGSIFSCCISPLSNAIELENFEIIQLLINHPKIDVNQFSTYGYYLFAESIDYFIITKGPALLSIIHKASCSYDHINIFKLLLSHPKVDVNLLFEIVIETNDKRENETLSDEVTPLIYLIQNNKKTYIDILLKSRQDVDISKKCIKKRIIDSVYHEGYRQYLFYEFTDENGKDDSGWYYFQDEYDFYDKGYYKCENYCEDVLEFSPLDIAIKLEDIDTVKFLLERQDIDVNLKSKINKYETKYFAKLRKGKTEISVKIDKLKQSISRNEKQRFRFSYIHLENSNLKTMGKYLGDCYNNFRIFYSLGEPENNYYHFRYDYIYDKYDDIYDNNYYDIFFEYFDTLKIKIKNKYHYEKNHKLKKPVAKHINEIKKDPKIREEFIFENFVKEKVKYKDDIKDEDAYEPISIYFSSNSKSIFFLNIIQEILFF